MIKDKLTLNTGRELSLLYDKANFTLLSDVFEGSIERVLIDIEILHLFCIVSWFYLGRWVKIYKKKLENVRDRFSFVFQNAFQSGLSGCMGAIYLVLERSEWIFDKNTKNLEAFGIH